MHTRSCPFFWDTDHWRGIRAIAFLNEVVLLHLGNIFADGGTRYKQAARAVSLVEISGEDLNLVGGAGTPNVKLSN